jgi:PAS domain-containing protein
VIVRIAHTRIATPADGASADARSGTPGDDHRQRLSRAAGRVDGLETLIVGWEAREPGASSIAPLVVVTAWRDVESMLAATRDEDAFLGDRLALSVAADRVESYEVMSRTFGALPTPTSVLRVLTMTASARAEASLFERLRDVQRRLTDHGLIASHIGRRVTDEGIEVLVVGVWVDRGAVEVATGGRLDRSAFSDEIDPWIETVTATTFDALEIAPRLPMASGPSILVLDDFRRVVDLTPAGAAAIGRTQDEAIGSFVEDLAAPDNRLAREQWSRWLQEAEAAGETAWAVPSGGHVMVRWRLRRNAPVHGRHALLIRRRNEPEPTTGEMDDALAEAFPSG